MSIFGGLIYIMSVCATLYVCTVNPMFGLLCVLVLIMGIVWFFSKEGRD
jgi:hypothetical protein